MIEQYPDGRQAGVITATTPRPSPVSFITAERDGDVYVLPSDAAGLVPQSLDLELFNVTKLAEYGYGDGVPVIIDAGGSAAHSISAAGDGLTVTGDLSSIDAVAATIHPGGAWWSQVVTRASAGSRAAPSATPGAGKVWLDERIESVLATSVPLIGAPTAWDRGLDGTGVTVAVLDTGIDADHPDLAGRVTAEANFTDSPTTTDLVGHGTHVAGIVAGSGAASNGTFTGVAPGSHLVNGKVLGDDGTGQASWAIAGMQWAVQQGADVINLSFGGEPTDGTDPLSQAVDQLAGQHDVLFVAAAGNLGRFGDHTVTAPGTADAALTVGADDRDAFNPFSGLGPRLGDFAIKPDVIAPGVNIVSARAQGSAIGPPVGEHYLRLTGTSMAAPHAAGAAAILRQQHPDLPAADLKALLATTATPLPGRGIYWQGGGRIHIPTALDVAVRATPATLDFGFLPFPPDTIPPAERHVTYTNRTDTPVDLTLSVEVTNRDGAASSALTADPDQITVPPGAAVPATVTLDPDQGDHGLYGGYLVATAGDDIMTRTPVGYFKEPERYDLTVVGITADGGPATGTVDVLDVHDRTEFSALVTPFQDGVARWRVPPGTYSVMADVFSHDHTGDLTGVVMGGDPQVEVASDTTIVVDARQVSPITIDTPAHPGQTTPTNHVILAYSRTDDRPGSSTYTHKVITVLDDGAPPVFAATGTPEATLGRFEFYSRWRLEQRGAELSPYLYDLVLPEVGAIPAGLHYAADPADLVTIDNAFHGDLAGHQMAEVRHSWRPGEIVSLQPQDSVTAGTERVEYLTGGQTLYRQQIRAGGALAGQIVEHDVRYQPGQQHSRVWLKQVLRPAVIEPGGELAGQPTTRTGDRLTVRIQEWVDSDGHWGASDLAVDSSAFRLYQDDQLIRQARRPQATVTVTPQPAVYRLELGVARDAPWWTTSTATRTVWTFRSQRPPDGVTDTLPLLLIDYDLTLDLLNTAPLPQQRTGPATVTLTIGHQPGAAETAVVMVRVWASHDDGQTWQPRPYRPAGDGQYKVILPSPDPEDGSGFVSLRVEAVDQAGNQVEQDIVRAYRLPPRPEADPGP